MLALIFIVSGSSIIDDFIQGTYSQLTIILNIACITIGLLCLMIAFPLTKKIWKLKKDQQLYG